MSIKNISTVFLFCFFPSGCSGGKTWFSSCRHCSVVFLSFLARPLQHLNESELDFREDVAIETSWFLCVRCIIFYFILFFFTGSAWASRRGSCSWTSGRVYIRIAVGVVRLSAEMRATRCGGSPRTLTSDTTSPSDRRRCPFHALFAPIQAGLATTAHLLSLLSPSHSASVWFLREWWLLSVSCPASVPGRKCGVSSSSSSGEGRGRRGERWFIRPLPASVTLRLCWLRELKLYLCHRFGTQIHSCRHRSEELVSIVSVPYLLFTTFRAFIFLFHFVFRSAGFFF